MPLSARFDTPPLRIAENEWRLFTESPDYLRSLVADIRRARRRAWVESYTIADDAAGRSVAEALIERAAAGVDCRLLYDAVGSFTTSARFFDDLRAAGVQVRAFHRMNGWLERVWWWRKFHRRDHRKLVVIDDDRAYFGGMNIVDLGGSGRGTDANDRLTSSLDPPWRDVHVRITGNQAVDLAATWSDVWNAVEGTAAPRRTNLTPRQILALPDDQVCFFDSRPHVKHHRPARVWRSLIDSAEQSITLAMAYFVPFGSVLRALVRARKRGVAVTVIVPQRSDVPLVAWASRHLYEKLLRHGVRIYERRDRMLHSKLMVVDGRWSVVGSCNFDPRSLLLNLELFAIVRSASLAATLGLFCRFERRCSTAVRIGHVRKRSWWSRLLQRTAWAFKRWL